MVVLIFKEGIILDLLTCNGHRVNTLLAYMLVSRVYPLSFFSFV